MSGRVATDPAGCVAQPLFVALLRSLVNPVCFVFLRVA